MLTPVILLDRVLSVNWSPSAQNFSHQGSPHKLSRHPVDLSIYLFCFWYTSCFIYFHVALLTCPVLSPVTVWVYLSSALCTSLVQCRRFECTSQVKDSSSVPTLSPFYKEEDTWQIYWSYIGCVCVCLVRRRGRKNLIMAGDALYDHSWWLLIERAWCSLEVLLHPLKPQSPDSLIENREYSMFWLHVSSFCSVLS